MRIVTALAGLGVLLTVHRISYNFSGVAFSFCTDLSTRRGAYLICPDASLDDIHIPDRL